MLIIRRTQLSAVGDQDFPVATACIWKSLSKPGSVLGKSISGAWPPIIWEATTSRTTVSNCPVLSNFGTTYVP